MPRSLKIERNGCEILGLVGVHALWVLRGIPEAERRRSGPVWLTEEGDARRKEMFEFDG